MRTRVNISVFLEKIMKTYYSSLVPDVSRRKDFTIYFYFVKKSVDFTVYTWRPAASPFTVNFTGVCLKNSFRNQDMVGLC